MILNISLPRETAMAMLSWAATATQASLERGRGTRSEASELEIRYTNSLPPDDRKKPYFRYGFFFCRSPGKPNYPNPRRNIDSIEGNRGIFTTNQRYTPSWPASFPCWTSLVFVGIQRGTTLYAQGGGASPPLEGGARIGACHWPHPASHPHVGGGV